MAHCVYPEITGKEPYGETDENFPISIVRQDDMNCFYSFQVYGNLLREDPKEFARRVWSGVERRIIKSEIPAADQTSEESELANIGFITSFYPPIWLGKFQWPTYFQRVMPGQAPFSAPMFNMIDIAYKDSRIKIYGNGALVIKLRRESPFPPKSKQLEVCLNYLNEIMGTFLLRGYPFDSVGVRDLDEAYWKDEQVGYDINAIEAPERRRFGLVMGRVLTEAEMRVLNLTQIEKDEIAKTIEVASKLPQDQIGNSIDILLDSVP